MNHIDVGTLYQFHLILGYQTSQVVRRMSSIKWLVLDQQKHGEQFFLKRWSLVITNELCLKGWEGLSSL